MDIFSNKGCHFWTASDGCCMRCDVRSVKMYRALIQSWTQFVVNGQNSFLSNPYHLNAFFLHSNTDLHVE